MHGLGRQFAQNVQKALGQGRGELGLSSTISKTVNVHYRSITHPRKGHTEPRWIEGDSPKRRRWTRTFTERPGALSVKVWDTSPSVQQLFPLTAWTQYFLDRNRLTYEQRQELIHAQKKLVGKMGDYSPRGISRNGNFKTVLPSRCISSGT